MASAMYSRLACYCLLALWTCNDDGAAEFMTGRHSSGEGRSGQ